jgi:hypothetical protein
MERLARWKLGLPIFEMFWASLIFGGIAIAALMPVVQWLRRLLW